MQTLLTLASTLWFMLALFYTIQIVLGYIVALVNFHKQGTAFRIQAADAILISILWGGWVFIMRNPWTN